MDIRAAILFCVFVKASLPISEGSDPSGRYDLEPRSTVSEVYHECDGEVFRTLDECQAVCERNERGNRCRVQYRVTGSRSGQGQHEDDEGLRSRSFPRARVVWRRQRSPCSVSCGVGQIRIEPICVYAHTRRTAPEERCGLSRKPSTYFQSCELAPCPRDSSSLTRSPSDDVFKTHFGDLFRDQIPALPKFYTGEWSVCSVTCGEGWRSREVSCQLMNSFTYEDETFPDSECFGRKPLTTKACNLGPCRGDLPFALNEVGNAGTTYRWDTGIFTDCSHSCKGGTQESKLRCLLEGPDEEEVSPSLCSGLKKPAVVVRPCNAFPCPPRWDIGDYGSCSKRCGGGVMRRSVRCVQEEADDILTQVEDFRCPDPVPITEISCNNVFCPAEWIADSWEECSETCGIGTQTRRVYCVKEPVLGHQVTVSDMSCLGPRPAVSRQCSVQDCPEDVAAPPVIKAENYTFIQLRRAKKVKLNVGGKILLLPGQSVTIRCPVKNFHRRLIFWSKHFKLVPMVGRVRASFNGNLKIRKANPVTDTGTYTCMAGPQNADVRIEFLSRKDAVQKIKDIKHYLKDQSSRLSITVRPGEPKYQDGVFQDGGYNLTKRFIYMADDWSPCSVTCGSGHQNRKVTCTRVTKKYVKILPQRECDRLGLEKPQEIRKCSPHAECPHWIAGNWSFCSLKTCVRDGYAERHRKLHCAYFNGTSAPSHNCNQKRRPETVRQCVNIDCISHWTTSKWTSCRPSCGKQGFKMRMLTCSWKKTGLPAWTACRFHPRPIVRKICKLRPCPSSRATACEDSSRYCSLARMLKMCRYNDFQRKCCRSCTEFLQSTLS